MNEKEISKTSSLVYDLEDIQEMLSIGRTSAYDFIRKVYKAKGPFIVIKLGSMYRIPKTSFDAWVEAGCPGTNKNYK